MFPNPADDKIVLDLDSTPDQVIIVSTDGQIVNIYDQFKSKEVDIAQINKGVYWVIVKMGENSLVTKLIKI